MARDDDTPSDRRLVLLRRRAERERLLQRLREKTELPPDYADERDSEPSVRASLSEPGRRLTVEGDPEDVERLMAQQWKQPTLIQRGIESMAPITDRMTSPKGKLVAKVSLVLGALASVIAALQQAISWAQAHGLLD